MLLGEEEEVDIFFLQGIKPLQDKTEDDQKREFTEWFNSVLRFSIDETVEVNDLSQGWQTSP